jgi:cytochrome c-type biogenesis protein CcmE
MKISHIIAIVAIAIGIGCIVSLSSDSSVYVTFGKAIERAQDGDSEPVHVVGKLKKDATGNIEGLFYKPQLDPNHFEFTLVDNDNRVQKCVYNSPKPADFDRSEQVVVIGAMQGDHFQTQKILLKCPSKYQEGKLETTEHEAKTAQL